MNEQKKGEKERKNSKKRMKGRMNKRGGRERNKIRFIHITFVSMQRGNKIKDYENDCVFNEIKNERMKGEGEKETCTRERKEHVQAGKERKGQTDYDKGFMFKERMKERNKGEREKRIC